MRTKFVAGNWKMFMTAASGSSLVDAVVNGITDDAVRVAVCPPFPYLSIIAQRLRDTSVALGAQNCYPAKEGAFTGEVSPSMLKDVGCKYVIIGHSERRHVLGESNAFINQKVKSALDANLTVIFCIGEKLDDRDANRTNDVLREQLIEGLRGVEWNAIQNVVIAYEPVWAIGTGRNATPEQAQEAHAFIRQLISQQFSPEIAKDLVIQYGGSVKPDNAAALMSQPDVDGALVGGASLQAESFLSIVRAAVRE
jgi:triosephosphate isomerase